LQLQELWEVVDGGWRMPSPPTPRTTGTSDTACTLQPTAAEQREHEESVAK
jgi:hypothetical protein